MRPPEGVLRYWPLPAIALPGRARLAKRASDLARQAAVWHFDALVAASFLLLVLLIVVGSAYQWYRLLAGRKAIELHESKFIQLAEVVRST